MMKLDKFTKDKPYLFFLTSAIFLTLMISVLVGTVFWMAYPTVSKTGIIEFIFGTEWGKEGGSYGIWIFIVGTFYMTAVTMCMAVPLGLFTAIYLSEFAHSKVRSIMKSSIELLVGIPSVVYGIFGLFILKDYLRDYVNPLISNTLGSFIPLFHDSGGSGTGVFLASVILTIMVIPTIISIAENAMRSVSQEYREGSIALGTTKWETIQKIVIPTALPGIVAGITLGMTRAVGETMAIVMLLGNTYKIPTSIFDTGYAMTSKILNDITYHFANPEVCSALFGIAAVLFIIEAIFIGIIRIISSMCSSGGGRNA
ncbi:MAG TPA: phosphate ABC transporter permease subunit PstC [Candidatus Altiarchaeales archaeon]|nr:phosphate ABC transporter permease subunit PstC [Candidatus Altiarchaeales archaeon]